MKHILSNLIMIVLLLTSCISPTSDSQKPRFIFHDDTNTINPEIITTAVQPLLDRAIIVAIYVVFTGCETDFDKRLEQDDLLAEGQLSQHSIAIFFPVPKNADCTFIRLGKQLKSEIQSINTNVLDKGLIPYLADRTPRIDTQIFGGGKSYSDTEALSRTLDSIDQLLWLLEVKPLVPVTKLFIYDHRKILDVNKVTIAAQPILDRAIQIDLFVLDDNSLSLDMMRDYLGLNSEDRIKSASVIGINLFTHLGRMGTLYTWNLAETFDKVMSPILMTGMQKVEKGEMTFTDLIVQSLNEYSLALSSGT